MPFVPLADKTGLHDQYRASIAPYNAQKKFESQYVHPILGKLEPYVNHPTLGTVSNAIHKEVPMREAYDKIIQAQGFRHNDITIDPNYINKLNSYRSSPNSQLKPIPKSISFLYLQDSKHFPRFNRPNYDFKTNNVSAAPLGNEAMKMLSRPGTGNHNGLYDYFNNYNYFDQNKYNNMQTSVVAHETIGHGGNQAKDTSSFYKPIAEREGKPLNEIVPIKEKFTPTYWSNEPNGLNEFTQSLHAAKRQGREWGYPVDSDNNDEVTQAFRDTFNRVQKIPLDQARQLPMESQRLRSYLNSARQYNSYDKDSSWLMKKMKGMYNYFKSYNPEDQNNPQLMDQITEDVLYYTTPETLKGLLSNNNNTQLNYV